MIYYLVLLIFIFLLYGSTCLKNKNIINLMFFPFVSLGLTMVFPYTISLFIDGRYALRTGDCYIIFYLIILFIGLFYIANTKKGFKVKQRNCLFNYKKCILILGTFVIIFFLLNMDSVTSAISNPRMFYANSRIGGGFLYYIVIPCVIFLYFCCITKLNYNHKLFANFIKSFIATLVVIGLIYIFGQKSSIVLITYLYLSTLSLKIKSKKKNYYIILPGLILVAVFAVIFSLYNIQQNINTVGLFQKFIDYADFLDNFNDLVDNLDCFYFGRIFFENEVMSYIPRALMPNKPTLFGSLQLGLNVPRLVNWTLSLTGAPSFGPIGTAYADFGIVGIILYTLLQLFIFYIARGFEIKLKEYNFWYHLLYLTFTGVLIFYLTLCTIPFYQYFVVIFLYRFCRKRVNTKKVKSIRVRSY